MINKYKENKLGIKVDQRKDRNAYMREYLRINSDKHRKLQRLQRERNPERTAYISLKSNSKSYILKNATAEDLKEFELLLNQRKGELS